MRLFSLLVLAVVAAIPFAQAEDKKNPIVVFETSEGSFEVELYAANAPVTVANFVQYVKDKQFDGTIFHRVIANFMIQGGGFTPDWQEKKTRDPIKNESGNGIENKKYNIAMARTNDLDSATCQFYINTVDNPDLDKGKYCAFGKVVAGTEIVDKIRDGKVKRDPRGEPSMPLEPVVIKSAKLKE